MATRRKVKRKKKGTRWRKKPKLGQRSTSPHISYTKVDPVDLEVLPSFLGKRLGRHRWLEWKTIWFFRPQTMYQRRFHSQYGHFTRDALLYMFWYMYKANMLDNPRWLVKIHQRKFGYQKPFIEFVKKVFPNVIFSKPGEPYPEGEQRVMKYVPSHFKKFWDGTEWKVQRDERFNNYVKWGVDLFRDYCFKRLNFKPEKKKRLLYVPRIAPSTNGGTEKERYGARSNRVENPYQHRKEYYNRYIDDVKFEEKLKNWCKERQYEFVHWQNRQSIPIEEQMKMYAESDIIIGPTGSDWTNAYYCDEKTLLIEVIPPTNHPGGMCETFNSEDQERAVKQNKYNKFPQNWSTNGACERNLRLIYNDEVIAHGQVGVRGMKYQMLLSEKNKSDIMKLLNEHV